MDDPVDPGSLCRALFGAVPVGVAMLDEHGAISAANAALCTKVRKPQEELIGRTPDDVVGTKGGWTGLPEGVDPPQIALFSGLDAALIQTQKLEAIGRLAGGIAHDFNNVLTSILGYTDLAARAVGPEGAGAESLSRLRRIARRGTALADRLRTFSRKPAMRPELLEAGELVGDAQELLGRLLGEDVTLESDADTSGAAWVMADRGQLEQVVVNLVVNARDAMPQGGVVRIEVEVGDGRVTIRVTDQGVGMDEAVRARVFEPFFTTKSPDKGTGLGLFTSYAAVQASGGSISVDSEPGRGARFEVRLPLARPPAERRPRAPEGQREGPRGNETILVVEGEPSVRNIFTMALRRRGYRVLAAEDGERALELEADHGDDTLHLLLSDVMLPGRKGPEIAEILRGRRPQMRVLFVSGYVDEPDTLPLGDDPTIAFLQKPLTPSRLAQEVRELLDAGLPDL